MGHFFSVSDKSYFFIFVRSGKTAANGTRTASVRNITILTNASRARAKSESGPLTLQYKEGLLPVALRPVGRAQRRLAFFAERPLVLAKAKKPAGAEEGQPLQRCNDFSALPSSDEGAIASRLGGARRRHKTGKRLLAADAHERRPTLARAATFSFCFFNG